MHNTTEIENDEIYDSIYMQVVELVEKDNISCGFYKDTANKLKDLYVITKRSDSTAENKVQQKGMKWVKLSERIPDKRGQENKVPIRSTDPKWPFVDEGFMNYADDPQMIIERGGKLMVTTEYPADHHSSFPKKYIEWLDESATDKPEELQEEVERLRLVADAAYTLLSCVPIEGGNLFLSGFDAALADWKRLNYKPKQSLNQK